jgi:tRNA/rRNA methyltransferase
VGATARAMKVMGFDDLVLVAPRWPNVLRREETIQRASGALDVLHEGAHCGHAGRGAGRRDAPVCHRHDATRLWPALRWRRANHFAALVLPQGHSPVAFLFGSERFGMANDDVYRCHTCLSIPTNPGFGSLNLGAAIQVIAYEWRMALGGLSVQPLPNAACADAESAGGRDAGASGNVRWWTSAFWTRLAPKKLMPGLNQLFNRAHSRRKKIHILRGVAKCCDGRSSRASSARLSPEAEYNYNLMFSRLRSDIQCILDRDPAARSTWEVLTCYPGLHVIWLHRLAHLPAGRGFKWLGRFISHIARLAHRHRDPPRRKNWAAGVLRPCHGRGGGRDRRDRRRLHHLPGCDAGRHVAVQGHQAPPHLGQMWWSVRVPRCWAALPWATAPSVGSNAVVIKPVPAGATAVGNPARIIPSKAEAQRDGPRTRKSSRPTASQLEDDPLSRP